VLRPFRAAGARTFPAVPRGTISPGGAGYFRNPGGEGRASASSRFTAEVNSAHVSLPNASTGEAVSSLSRTRTRGRPHVQAATSQHAPFPALRRDFRHAGVQPGSPLSTTQSIPCARQVTTATRA
jgi:hypothetical protein